MKPWRLCGSVLAALILNAISTKQPTRSSLDCQHKVSERRHVNVIPIDIPELGNRSYLVHDDTVAIVIDPSRRTKQMVDIAKDAGVTIKAVFETHVHNDYVTGGLTLAQQLKVPYYVSAHDEVSFTCDPIEPDQLVLVGKLMITALA